MLTRRHIPASRLLAITLAGGLLAGCSSTFGPSSALDGRTPIGNIQGMVRDGQSPVSGGHVYLYEYAAGSSGPEHARSLISPSETNVYEDGDGNYFVKTAADGSFSLRGDYTCDSDQQVYLVAVGTSPELTVTQPGTPLEARSKVSTRKLGRCPSGAGTMASQVPYVVINDALQDSRIVAAAKQL